MGIIVSRLFFRGWLGYTFALLFILSAIFMIVTCFIGNGSGLADELKVVAPPAMNAMEQLLAVQNAISQAEELIQDANVFLLKSRALLLAIFPQVSLWSIFALFCFILLATYQVFYGQIARCISDGILQALLAKSLVIYFGGEQLFCP